MDGTGEDEKGGQGRQRRRSPRGRRRGKEGKERQGDEEEMEETCEGNARVQRFSSLIKPLDRFCILLTQLLPLER
jgi:hypothetical protein